MFRGYDDTFFWAIDDYFKMFVPAIRKFCEDWLEWYGLEDSKHSKVMLDTLVLLDELETEVEKYDLADRTGDIENMAKQTQKVILATSKFWEYFGKHIGYYWT